MRPSPEPARADLLRRYRRLEGPHDGPTLSRGSRLGLQLLVLVLGLGVAAAIVGLVLLALDSLTYLVRGAG